MVTHIELDVELVFDHLVNVPALAEPLGSVFVRLQTEPVVVVLLVLFDVLFREK